MVVITGAAGGLGLAFARSVAAEGAAVTLADVNDSSQGVKDFIGSNEQAIFVKTDVRSAADARRLVDTTMSEFGRVDVLINSAALLTTLARKPIEDLSMDDWHDVLNVNVLGTFTCTQAAVAVMKAQRSGKVINVGSNVVHKGLPNFLPYVASKGAVHAMTRALAKELGPFGITVNAVAPGYVMHEGTAKTDAGRNEQVIPLRPLSRTETPDDLVGTMVFLASDQSDFITGQTFVVDGGEVFA